MRRKVSIPRLTISLIVLSAAVAVETMLRWQNNTHSALGGHVPSVTAATPKVAAAPPGPLPGNLMIADRGNDRVIIVTPQKKTIWSKSFASLGGSGGINALGPDDAFFTPDRKHIIVNEEDDHAIALIDIATKKIVWNYGHPGVPGSLPGYLNTPDDAYVLPSGIITTADIHNQRILFINPKTGKVVKKYGTTGQWYHNPPDSFAAPNGDTPLPSGGMVVTEIGCVCADILDAQGHLIRTVHFPHMTYPSDTQMMPNGDLLVADYSTPGRVEIVNRQGQVVWQYFHSSGPGELSNPSLAIRLPNGNIAVNDDYNDRVVVINPKRNRIVWQYGHKGVPGTARNYLWIPDGMDLMPAGALLSTHG